MSGGGWRHTNRDVHARQHTVGGPGPGLAIVKCTCAANPEVMMIGFDVPVTVTPPELAGVHPTLASFDATSTLPSPA